MFFIDTIRFAVFDLIGAAFQFTCDNPGSSMFDLRFLDATFAANRLDSSACKYSVSDVVDEWIGSIGVHIFAVHCTMLVNQDFEYLS